MSLAKTTTDDETATLPVGVSLTPLTTHPDPRGELTEIFRREWHHSPLPVQWTVCRSTAKALRGVHADARHWDYLCVVEGDIVVGLHDLRPEEQTARRSAMLHLDDRQLRMLLIPPGVAHGCYSPAGSTILHGSSRGDGSAEPHRCRWDSPELGLAWPCTAPELSQPDRDAGGYASLRAALVAADPRCAQP